ncbi:bifunctional molybdenum cofactor biosynthesis protein MoaC/MoaB [Nocardia speluncae]|uniref:Cyclic pyranopterin monophosphate synthase n=1 Tax=Nocardia speluncae TaxID=419477 RepID=A0A846XLK1_9NOCA|nr:bifunctional molybdenum cofactor biosynthesis protein MoaC/MoaB [Nocardia speluncae]NKY35490.1 bifunctional molybdenum cofactor biosynthesis protein MoaC/MoaB [Nocardia speluncae]
MSELSHVDSAGRARMVDVSAKPDTTRIAVAGGELLTTPEVVALVRADGMPKADVLATARLAGIAAAKKTSDLIPLCHQLALSSVKVEFGFTDSAITIEAAAKTTGPTGVEMEALTAVAVAGLTLHDMVKAVDPAAVLNGVRLLTKEGGKRGQWRRPDTAAAPVPQPGTFTAPGADTVPAGTPRSSAAGSDAATRTAGGSSATYAPDGRGHAEGPDDRAPEQATDSAARTQAPGGTHSAGHDEHARMHGADTRDSGADGGALASGGTPARPSGGETSGTAVVVVASTGAAAGTRTDTTGPHLVAWLRGLGYSTRGPLVYADADIAGGLTEALRTGPDLVVTTGGTGAAPSDRTPEATAAVLDRELPGVAEAIRRRGTAKFPLAALSRGVAGLAGQSVVVNLPGSPGGVKDGIAVLEPLLGHLLAQVAGGGAHEGGQGASRAERGNESAHA